MKPPGEAFEMAEDKGAGNDGTIPLAGKAELLRVIAHPVRLMLLEELARGVKCVSDLEDFLEIGQPNVSQHLSLLRRHGVIDYYMDGRLRCYYLVEPMVPDVIGLVRKDYPESLPAPACCPVTKKGKYPGRRKG